MDEAFEQSKQENIRRLRQNEELRRLSVQWITEVSRLQYSYNFTWMDRPIIQFPPDIVAMQEIIWQVRPDLIVETGVARGGSLIFYASMLELLGGDGRVVGIDIDIREHNRVEIEAHPMIKRITMIEGSSTDEGVVQQVRRLAADCPCVMVVLDSMHTHDHVLAELRLYSALVTTGSYLAVMDTIIDDMPADCFPDRPWGPGNNPATAVREFLQDNDRFVVDHEIDGKLLITVAPSGYLKCVKD
jgi:cephalosporin hydroxylase